MWWPYYSHHVCLLYLSMIKLSHDFIFEFSLDFTPFIWNDPATVRWSVNLSICLSLINIIELSLSEIVYWCHLSCGFPWLVVSLFRLFSTFLVFDLLISYDSGTVPSTWLSFWIFRRNSPASCDRFYSLRQASYMFRFMALPWCWFEVVSGWKHTHALTRTCTRAPCSSLRALTLMWWCDDDVFEYCNTSLIT